MKQGKSSNLQLVPRLEVAGVPAGVVRVGAVLSVAALRGIAAVIVVAAEQRLRLAREDLGRVAEPRGRAFAEPRVGVAKHPLASSHWVDQK